MSIDLILFIILATVAVATALGMLLSKNSVYSALFLVLNFATIAVFYLLLGAPFIAISQVTVYAGAIMVLFLFVIMLLGADQLPKSKVLRYQWVFAVGLALILAGEAFYILFGRHVTTGAIFRPADALNTVDSLREIGKALFSNYLLPFEVTSILLLVAMVGAIVLSKREKGDQR
jgi:NADH-quinone oxidoreductase subunit J